MQIYYIWNKDKELSLLVTWNSDNKSIIDNKATTDN